MVPNQEATIAQLPVSGRAYYRTVYAMVVTIFFGNPSRIYLTDYTDNQALQSTYFQTHRVGNSDKEIEMSKILQVSCYNEKMNPFCLELEQLGLDIAGGSNTINIVGKAVFVKCDLKLKQYNGVIDGTVRSIRLVRDYQFKQNPKRAVFKNVIQGLPSDFVENFKQFFIRTIPREYIDSWLNGEKPTRLEADLRHNSTPSVFGTPSTPYGGYLSGGRRPNFETPQPVSSRIPSTISPTPFHQQRNELQPFQRKLNDVDTTPRKKQRTSLTNVKQLNSISEIDGKTFNVVGTIVEIEPLSNQFCIKDKINSPPELMPLTFILRGELSGDDELDELSFIRISILEKSQILRFLGMSEIEEVYVRSSEVYDKFIEILKQRKEVEINVQRRLIKINDIGSTLLGWESNDITLEKLLKST